MNRNTPVPSVYIKTIGCRLNQAESARIAASFRAAGYALTEAARQSDVCVVHTCAVTANAERKCMQFARSVKRKTPDTLVVLAGCAAEVSAERLRQDTGADLVVGQADKWRLPELLAGKLTPPAPLPPASPSSPPLPLFSSTRALVKVQDGCDFRCAYCIVPCTRGNPVSRPLTSVVEEVRRLAGEGFREVVLTGANLACYRDGESNIVSLLQAVEPIEGIRRIRLSSIEVSTAERDIVEYMAGSEKLCRYLHFPLQSGSDTVLRRMRRRYAAADYRRLVEFAVDRIRNPGLGTDIIVGFPGEDESHFNATVDLVGDLPFSNLHVFPYSVRQGTPAATMSAQVDEQLKKERVEKLVSLGQSKKEQFAESLIGCTVEVLVEQELPDGRASGWTREYVRANTPGTGNRKNDIVEFTPTASVDGVLEDTPGYPPQNDL